MKANSSIFDPALLRPALLDACRKLDPRVKWKNPVMFVVFLGSIVTTCITVAHFSGFYLQLTIWLWFTVLFANFAEAMAEGRGKAQAATLRKMRTTTMARRLVNDREEQVAACDLKKGDLVVCEANDAIPGDGEVIEGIASVDESAITGESAPVIRESGGDRSAVTGGTRVISDRIVVRITSEQGDTFIDRMIAMVESNKGTGHPWPVLAGERGQYEVDRGAVGSAIARLDAMRNMSSGVGLIPEQAWDLPPTCPTSPFGSDPRRLRRSASATRQGRGARPRPRRGRRMSQFVRLTLDTAAGSILDRPSYTVDRYVPYTQGQTHGSR